MIAVYGAYNLPFDAKGIVRDIRVMWALEELGLPYAFHWMDALKGEHKLEANRAINPFGKIPSMTDGDVKLFETGAIVLYLYDKARKLPEQPVAKAKLLQWMFAAVNTVEPPLIEILRWNVFWRDRPGRDARYPELIGTVTTVLSELEGALGDRPYLLGGEFSLADIMMTTVLEFARTEPSVFEHVPLLNSYSERCKARPAYRKALSKQGVGPGAKVA